MRVLLAGGGTAGHINPAIAIGNFIKKMEQDAKILYVGAKGSMEERLVPEAGFDFRAIGISGFDRKINLQSIKKNILTLKRIITSSLESKKIISNFLPDICIGTGGYVSGPVLRIASKMGFKTLIHEQNALPGMTTKMLSSTVNCVMLATEVAKNHLSRNINIRVTGNPIREEIILSRKEQSKKMLKLDERPVILSFGGSLGSDKINTVMAGVIAHNVQNGNRYQHVHAYGRYNDEFLHFLKDKGVEPAKYKNIRVEKYIDMPHYLAASDLVISRSGAITVSELQAAGKPSILIPSPNVSGNHQYHNAMELVNRKAAKLIEEKNLTESYLLEIVEKMFSDKSVLKFFSENSQKMAILDADKRIYEIIKETLDPR
ncbi:MAG: undecaprenyldiphospho-muramoylpentapeptide beta-N-acetylglucosaminyltransferase [Oscillospiraceae bacterium]|jgi:UDP-N-acetylglucosamine--N-acetylmuramyl-(pentapeptide) pyrophosphoryl-undecaprenol N-acetylglucosamine transferase|nr:undecaprenyldiphospho-muramoylpentapeptide beta-N-acetylglucosaminyltransferase [Oscillospiraceae bacterium]